MSIRDSINTSIKNIANDIASMIQSRADNTLSNLTDEGVEYIKELAEIKAGEYANQELSNLTATGLSQYNVFCVNTGEVDDDGNPAFLTITTGSIIPENPTSGGGDDSQALIVQNAEDAYDDTDDTDENTDEDTTTATQTLLTSDSFDITTANGKIYTVTDTLTLDISDYEDGEYYVYVNPVDLTLSVKSHTLTAGSAFPSDAVSGDYLLNTSQVPYDLQEITITTTTNEETQEETTTTTITKSLNEVFAGTLTISSGEGNLTLNCYNKNIIGAASSSDNTIDTSDLDKTYEKIEKTILFPEADENYCFNLTDNSINRITFPASESDEAEEDEYEDEVVSDLETDTSSSSSRPSSSSSSSTESSETVTYTIVLPEITDTDKYHQILVQIDYQNSVTLDLGTTYFFNQEEPDFSNTGAYNLVYEHNGSNWCVGCIYKGEV